MLTSSGRVSSIEVVPGDQRRKGGSCCSRCGLPTLQLRGRNSPRPKRRGCSPNTTRTAPSSCSTEAPAAAGDEAQADSALACRAQAEEQRAAAVLAALGGSHGSNEYQLKSPIAGVVVERNVAVGTEVHADQDKPLITVADLSTLWVMADVYEQDLARIRVGDEARVHVPAFPDTDPVGHITYVGNTVDPITRVAVARIEIPNPDSSLRPGMFANVQVKGLSDGVVDVPLACAARAPRPSSCSPRTQMRDSWRSGRRPAQHGQHIQILSGLAPGDPVVSEGAILLDAEANEAL